MKTQLIKGLIGLALVGLSTLSFSADHESTAKHSISKELVKQTTASGVTTFDWVIKYENLSGGTLTDVEIKDTFSGNQSYVPSSEQHPNGWSTTQSGNTLQWNAGLVGTGGYSRPFSPIPTSGLNITNGGNGDGWGPIPYTALNGDFRIYYINHHKTKSQNSFGCVGSCLNASSWPKSLPAGDGVETTTTGYSVKSEIVNRKLYYGSTRNLTNATQVAQDWGVACFDLETDTECGYTPLSANPSGRSITYAIEGPFKANGLLYFLDGDLLVHCYNPSGSIACGSYDLKSSTTAGIIPDSVLIPNTATESWGGVVGGVINGSQIIFEVGNPAFPTVKPTGGKFFCVETLPLGSCSGWSDAVVTTRTDRGFAQYFHRDTNGVATHVCSNRKNSAGGTFNSTLLKECFKLSDGTLDSTVPDIISPTYSANNPIANMDVNYGLRGEIYLPIFKKSFFVSLWSKNIFCYDWASSSPCITEKITTSSGALVYDQALDRNGCAWVLGHNSKLWSYDPETSETPCQKEEFDFEGTFDASKNWCATEDPQWSYTQFEISNIHASDFEEIIVEFLDLNGTVFKVKDITGVSSYSLGISTGVFSAGEPIHYRIKIKLASGVTKYTTLPVVTIGVDGPPQEFCLSTTVECPNTEPVVNSVTASVSNDDGGPVLGGESIPDVSDEVTVDAESFCLPIEPKSCLVIEPKLECIKGKGWHVSFTNNTSNYNPTDLDITSLTPGVTVVGNSPSWTLSGVTPNSTVKFSANGVMKNGGSEKGTDLCCSTEVEIEIPDEECKVIIENPEEACMTANYEGPFYDKAKEQWAFNLGLSSLNGSTINEVKVTPITSGVTLTNGPIYPVGTPSLSFTGVTAGQTAEFKFCAYNKDDMTENETFDCCKMNVKVEIGGISPIGLPKKEGMK